jgi:uncharacterized membrane protein YdjX (TVP38/TMEM64 family)
MTNVRTLLISLLAVALVVALAVTVDVSALFAQLQSVSTPTAALLSTVIGVLCTVLLVPTSPLNLFAGARFGVLGGTLVTLFSLQFGAMLAFLLARSVPSIQRWSRSKLDSNASLNALANALSGPQGPKLVFLTRIAPVFPFALLNYVYALSNIDFVTFSVWTFLGNAPACALYSYAAASATTASSGGLLSWFGPVASIVSVVAISSYAKGIIDSSQTKK